MQALSESATIAACAALKGDPTSIKFTAFCDLVSAVTRHISRAVVVEAYASTIHDVASSEDTPDRVKGWCGEPVIKLLMDCMAKHPRVVSLQESAFAALDAVVNGSFTRAALFAEVGGFARVFAMAQPYLGNAAITAAVCHLCHEVAMFPELVSVAVTAGAVRRIVAAMDAHPTHVDLLVSCITSLKVLCHHADGKATAMELDAMARVGQAKQRFPEDETLGDLATQATERMLAVRGCGCTRVRCACPIIT